jgi:hypothetical protein
MHRDRGGRVFQPPRLHGKSPHDIEIILVHEKANHHGAESRTDNSGTRRMQSGQG